MFSNTYLVTFTNGHFAHVCAKNAASAAYKAQKSFGDGVAEIELYITWENIWVVLGPCLGYLAGWGLAGIAFQLGVF